MPSNMDSSAASSGRELEWPQETPRQEEPRGPRWGLRTLACLGFAALCIVVSSYAGGYAPGTVLGLIAGLAAASYCSWRGLRAPDEKGMPGTGSSP